jgi:hypothetical protein
MPLGLHAQQFDITLVLIGLPGHTHTGSVLPLLAFRRLLVEHGLDVGAESAVGPVGAAAVQLLCARELLLSVVLGGPAAAALAAQNVGEIHRQDSTEQNDIHQHLKISKHLGTSSSWKF